MAGPSTRGNEDKGGIDHRDDEDRWRPLIEKAQDAVTRVRENPNAQDDVNVLFHGYMSGLTRPS